MELTRRERITDIILSNLCYLYRIVITYDARQKEKKFSMINKFENPDTCLNFPKDKNKMENEKSLDVSLIIILLLHYH